MDRRNYNSDQFQVDNRVEYMLPKERGFTFQRHITQSSHGGLPTQHATGEGWEKVSDAFTRTNKNGEVEEHPAYYQGSMLHPGSGRGGIEDANIAGDDLRASQQVRKGVLNNYLPPADDEARQSLKTYGYEAPSMAKDNLIRPALYASDVSAYDAEKLALGYPIHLQNTTSKDAGGYYHSNPNARHIAINDEHIPTETTVPTDIPGGIRYLSSAPVVQKKFNSTMTHELGHAIDPFVESPLRNTDRFRERGQSKKSYPHPIHEGVAEGFTQQRGHPQTYSTHYWKDPVNQALYIASLTHTYQQPRRYQGTGVDKSLEPTSPEDMVAKHVKNVQGPLDAQLSKPLPEKKIKQREKGLLQYAQMKAPMHTLGRMWEELPHVRDALRAHGLHDVAEDAAEHYKMFTRGVDPKQLELPF